MILRISLILLALVSACGYESDLLPSPEAALKQAGSAAVRLASQAEVAAGEALEGSYIVTFRSDALPRGFGSYLAEYRHHYTPLVDRFMADPRVADINYIDHVNLADPGLEGLAEELEPPPALQFAFTSAKRSPVMGTIAEVRFHSAADASSALAEWESEGAIWFAEPNYLSRLSGPFADLRTQYLGGGQGLWWHKMMNLFDALDALDKRDPPITQTYSPVIAVLDSGLDTEHEAFANGRLWENPAPGASGCPGDKNGCDTTQAKKGTFGVGVVKPYGSDPNGRACLTDEDSSKNCPHGTHVAGIIAGNWGGNYGGVCPFCRIMPVKIIAKVGAGGGSASDAAILNGMKYLTRFVNNNKLIVRVVNSSFGKYSRSRAVSILVAVLAKSHVLGVGAASNEDSMVRTYPASISSALAVAALNQDYQKASYSNYGPWVDVAAPGGEGRNEGPSITSANPGGGATFKSGTSMACPMVSGVAGLVLAVDPNRSLRSLRASIVNGANPMIYNADVAGGFNRTNYYPKIQGDNTRRPLLGSGVVDIKCAISGDCKSGLDTGGKDRVTQGCSVVEGGAAEASFWALVLALAAPLALVAMSARRRA